MSKIYSTHNNFSPENHNRKSGFFYHLVKWALVVILVVMILGILFRPVFKKWSKNYSARGDIYLEQKKYLSAIVEYQKALLLYSDNTDASDHKNLADKAQSDVLILLDFYKEKNLSSQIDLFAQAQTESTNPAEATKIAKELIEAGEYQLAIIPAKLATTLDKNYEDSWVYLAIANLDVSQKVEISAQNRQQYENNLTEAKKHITTLPEILK